MPLRVSPLRIFTRDQTTAFYGNFYFWVNVTALVLQAFVASRLLKYGQPREDVEKTIGVTSDLCYAIDDAFREKGIDIPFPQQDVYVKQLGPNTVSESESASPAADLKEAL